MRAVEYARYSSDLQKASSIQDQFRNLDEYAGKQPGWEVVERYSDEAISGTVTERPGYQAMLTAAEAGEFDILLVDDLSRLSRNNAEFLRVLEELVYWQVRVVAPSDGFDSGRENYEVEATVFGLKNSIFNKDLAKKVHRGLTGLALRGFSCGARNFGYRHVKIYDPVKRNSDGEPLVIGSRREVVPSEAEWVVKIFSWYGEGRSPSWITNELNRLQVPARRNKVHFWTISTVRRLLENRIYIGEYTWNKHRFIKKPKSKVRKKILRPESEWVKKIMPELRIISDELWEKVRAREAELSYKANDNQSELHASARTGGTGKFLFSGLLKCGVCGKNFAIVDSFNYGCGGKTNRGRSSCTNNLKVNRKVLENTLLTAIREELFSPEGIALFQKEVQRLLAENQKQKSSNKDDQSRRLAQIEQEIANLLTAIKAGILTATTKAELERLEAEKKSLERALAQNPELNKVVNFMPRCIDNYKRLVDDLGNTLQSDVVKARHQLRLLLGNEIRLIPEGNELRAEIQGNYAGLFHLAAPKIKAQSVSRVRFYDSPQ